MSDLWEDVIKHYDLRSKATPDGFVYVKVRKGMHGPPQARLLAQELLKNGSMQRGITIRNTHRDFGLMKSKQYNPH